jgi:predicted kinase
MRKWEKMFNLKLLDEESALWHVLVKQDRPVLYMMVGVTGSGKSTAADALKRSGSVVISTDDMIESIAFVLGTTYADIFKDIYPMVQKYSTIMIKKAINDRRNIVWDQTNLTPLIRKKKLDMFPKEYYKVAVAVLAPSWDELMKRQDTRKKEGKVIPSEVTRQQWDSFTMPQTNEGFDEVWRVYQDGTVMK